MKLLILCVSIIDDALLCAATLLIMIHGLSAASPGQEVLSIGQWREQVVAPEFLLEDREDIMGNRNPFFYEDKRSFRPESLGEQVKRITGTGEDVGLQPRLVTRSLQCTCETQFEMRDLGEGHYPRYLTLSRCKPKACQSKFNACRLLHYMVHVLSPRDLNGLSDGRYSDDSTLLETPLPESLRDKWQMKRLDIPVACVPMTR